MMNLKLTDESKNYYTREHDAKENVSIANGNYSFHVHGKEVQDWTLHNNTQGHKINVRSHVDKTAFEESGNALQDKLEYVYFEHLELPTLYTPLKRTSTCRMYQHIYEETDEGDEEDTIAAYLFELKSALGDAFRMVIFQSKDAYQPYTYTVGLFEEQDSSYPSCEDTFWKRIAEEPECYQLGLECVNAAQEFMVEYLA
jgi:hypothetical protein